MSIFAALGAVPARLTVPLTPAAVAGSIGAAAGAAAPPGAADSFARFLTACSQQKEAHNATECKRNKRLFSIHDFPIPFLELG